MRTTSDSREEAAAAPQPFWRGIAWDRAWLAPYRHAGRDLCRRLESGASVASALNEGADAGSLPRFVPHAQLPGGEAYEAFIARTGAVPTRDNLHDLFNGLVWLAFPRVKRRLNELQAGQIARLGIGPTRGVLRDALTLFDENAAWLQASPELVDALRRRDWRTLFIERRSDWPTARLTVFGHALLEKLAQPRKAITAHVWCLPEDTVDAESAVQDLLASDRLAARQPLPVLGVPGWWPGNEVPAFYDDPAVFRAR